MKDMQILGLKTHKETKICTYFEGIGNRSSSMILEKKAGSKSMKNIIMNP